MQSANADIKNRIDIPYVDRKNTIENFVDKKYWRNLRECVETFEKT